MNQRINDFSMTIATVNGSGSQSANNILMRSIFTMGVPVSGKNLFPSNIAGLPTWFFIRVNEKGYLGREKQSDIVVAMNKQTLIDDFKHLKPGGLFIYNSALRVDLEEFPKQAHYLGIDFNSLAKEVSDSIQLKKLLVNMIYVGVLAQMLGISEQALAQTIEYQFKGKEKVYQMNRKAVSVGRDFIQREMTAKPWMLKVENRDLTQNQILIDGNTASALGLVFAGCSFAAWYPITPSSSLAEGFANYCDQFRTSEDGTKKFSMIQAEDELSAIAMVAGAGWAGARAMTATSGPGLSLMTETIGLMYFAEIPGVIWDVQRMGPSTGLPTRTSQGDILAAAHCSHGDTRHPIFLPCHPKECFEFAALAFDLSERAQTPVFVLSDLDLGMNSWVSDRFAYSHKEWDRGKVLRTKDLQHLGEFARYADKDGDGIPYRTLPGTQNDLAAYFTRGTGHTPEAKYSEDPVNYQQLMDRLDKKWETIKTLVPAPEVKVAPGARCGIIDYGSTSLIVDELFSFHPDQPVSRMRLKSYPFHRQVGEFLQTHDRVLVIEQNQQGQMAELLRSAYPAMANKIGVETSCDGMPLCAKIVSEKLLQGGLFEQQ